ncbi:MAG TPA: enoyl-CoA hydratase/isomerase family protein, partial [Noviherbaspirillum sp.]
MTTNSLIDLQVQSGIATLYFNRPEKRNAMSDDMRTEFIAALERVAGDKAIKALVITGNGKGFCAGGDISGMEKRMQAPQGEIAFNGWHRQQRVHHTQTLLHTMPKPTIAA